MGKRRPRNKGERGRGYMKTYDSRTLNTGRSVDIFKMLDAAALRYTARAKSLGVNEEFLAMLERLFGFEVRTGPRVMNNQQHLDAEQRSAIDDPFLRVEQRLRELREEVPAHRYVKICAGRRFVLKLFFTSDCKYWWFIEERINPLKISKSITYGERGRALRAYASGTIRWKEEYFPAKEMNNGDESV